MIEQQKPGTKASKIEKTSASSKFLKLRKFAAASTASLALFANSLFLPTPARSANLEGKTVLLPIGTTFEGRMDSTISSGHSKEGDHFTIGMSAPVLANGSVVIIPAGSQILGEVVEAIPSGHLKKEKRQPKPHGKLRIQLSGLRTPDGITYPLVGSLAPETFETNRSSTANPNLGGGVAYVGGENSFDANAPSNVRRGGPSGAMSRSEMTRNTMYGRETNQHQQGSGRIRSLTLKGHELTLLNGSPVTVSLDAPLKVSVSSSSAAAVPYQSAQERANRGGRRFSQDDETAPSSGPFTPGTLPFLQKNNTPFVPNGTPQQAPAQPQAPGRPAGASEF